MPAIYDDRLTGISTSVAVKAPCAHYTEDTLPLSGLRTINGNTPEIGDRVLRNAPTDQINNGIWVVAESQWSRAKDFDGSRDAVQGTLVLVYPATSGTLFYELQTPNPVLIGSSNIEFEAADAGTETVLVDLANKVNQDLGANLVGLGISLAYDSGTVGKAIADRVWSITDYPFNAVGDGTTDNYAAILAAQTALAAAGGGTLVIPRGTFRIATAIPRVANVDFVGLGWSSILRPDGCGAFTYSFVTGFGQSATRNFRISAVNGGSQIGIYQPGTTNANDELYGVTIENMAINGFNVAIQFRTARIVTIRNNWIENVNSGILLIGKCINWFVRDNKIVKAAGAGTGTSYGIRTAAFTYTTGGTINPEGLRFESNMVFGFEYGEYYSDGIEIRTVNADISATRIGIVVSSVQDWSLIGGYVQVNGSLGQFGIHFPAQGSSNNTKYSIKGVNVKAVSAPASCSGIMLGTRAVTGNADGVTIEDCTFTGFTAYDIEQFTCGHNRIIGNRCASSGTTQSISVTACVANKPSYVQQNNCAKAITYDAADFNSGLLQLGPNVINGTTFNFGNEEFATPAFSAGNFTASGSMTWTVAAGDVATYRYKIVGRTMTLQIYLNTTTVGGTLSSQLRIAVPAGRTIANNVLNNCIVLDNNVRTGGYLIASSGLTYVTVNRADAANWSASTDLTYVFGEIVFEV